MDKINNTLNYLSLMLKVAVPPFLHPFVWNLQNKNTMEFERVLMSDKTSEEMKKLPSNER